MRSVRIDAHQHFWDPERFPYPWMPPAPSALRRRFLPEDFIPVLDRNRFDGSVVVQAATTMEESHWLLDLAQRHPTILGVVAWVDLTSPDLGFMLDQLQHHPKFKGVRHPVHDEPDSRWLLRADVVRGLRELALRDVPYDLLLRPLHLPLVPELAERVPELRFVIDHLAKPEAFDGWAEDMTRIAQIPQAHVKLSGLYVEPSCLKPYVSHLLDRFGAARLMFGSDWPVCLLAGSWKLALASFTQAHGALAKGDHPKIVGETAAEFYSLAVNEHE
jgi:L-fuconolactonase